MADESRYEGEERRREPREPHLSRALPPDESLHDARFAELDEHGRPLSRQRKRKAARRALKIVAGLVGGVVVVAAGAVFVLTNTDWGRERVRRQALALLSKQVHGRVRIGAIRGNLLTGATIENLVITDSAGAPFVAAERVKARYSLRGILDKKLVFSDVELLRPVIVLDRPPDGHWNWKRIFAKKDTPDTPKDTTLGYGDWVAFENTTLIDGRLIVKTPWHPSAKLTTQAQKDSATRVALAGGSRNRVIQVSGGYQKVMDFRSLDGRFPLLRIKDPEHQDMLVRVASANAVLAMFLPPEGDLRDAAGDFHIWNDSLTFQGVRAAFPGSKVTGSGRYVIESGELQLETKGAPAALADFRWAYPRLPSQGGGSLGFNMHWMVAPEEAQRYEMVDADVRVGKSHLVGDLGFTLTDTVEFHGTDLRVADFDTRLMEQLIEGFEMPVNGTATGRLALSGGLADLHIDTDLAFTEPKTGTSRAALVGVMGFGDEGFVKAQGLRMRLYPAQVGLARVFLPDFPLGGTLTGLLTLDGTPDKWLASSADVRHTDLGQTSHIVGKASLGFSAFPARELNFVDADVRVSPLALAPTVGRYAPSLGLRGATSGTIALNGPFSNLRVNSALRTSDGGGLRVAGTVDIANTSRIGYNLRAGLDVFDASALVASMPRTQLSLDAAARGRGTDPATMTSDVALAVRASKWNAVAVDSARLAASVAQGILTLDTLLASGPGVHVGAGGRFGLVADKRGDLTYAVTVDSLGALRRWIPIDSGEVAPRPAVVQQALARARGDSTRLAKATEAERAVTGAPMPRIAVDTPSTVKRDSLAGRVWAAGRVVGTLKDFDARGRIAAQGVVWNGNTVGAARAEYAWTDAPGTKGSIVLGADLDTVRAAGFDLERVETRIAHGMQQNGGLVQLLLRQSEGKEYAAHADYRLHPDHREVHLDDLRLRFDTTTWASARPGNVKWGTRGIEVDNIDLRHGPTGRVFVDGFIPRSSGEPASLQASITDFEVGDVVTLAQSDLDVRGRLSAGVKFQGTLADPRFTGAVGVIDPVWRGSPLPELRTAFGYDGTRLTATAQALQDARLIASAEGRVAVRLGSGTGPRISKSTPLQATIIADSLPLDALPKFTDAVANVQGRAVGRIDLAGTVGAPKATGAMAFDLGSFKIVPTGTRFTRLAGRVRLLGDSVVVDTLGGWAGGGPVSLEGGVGIADLSKPSVDLRLTTSDARLLDNDQGKVTADVEASMYGPFDNVYVNGRVRVREGVIYLPENDHREVIQSGDPALFAVADTSVAGSEDELLPSDNPFMKNLKMSIGLLVDRNTWVRSAEANVEVFSEDWLRISVDRRTSSIVLDGVLSTERGQYTFLSKRFEIRRGSATFVGTPDLNPTVQATAEYEVRVPSREALFIRLLIGGTVRAPRLSLESSSQPPINQSDLLSYLAFGRSSSSLLQMGGSGLGSGGSGSLAGATGALARNQIAGIALGVAVDEMERGFARRASLDVFNITPAPDVQTELLNGDVGGFARSTEVEGGRYWNQSRLFTAAQVRLGTIPALIAWDKPTAPGLTVQYRFNPQWRLESSLAPRFLLQTPTLETQDVKSTSVLGMFLIREWRF